MIAVAAAGAIGGIEARRLRSMEAGVAAALALPILVDMAVATAHPTIPEPLTAPFAIYAYAAALVAARSRAPGSSANSALFEYIAAFLAVVPTVVRASEVGPLLGAGGVALVMVAAASRWRLTPTAYVAIGSLAWLSVTRLLVNVRLDEIRIALGLALLGLCVANVRYPQLLRTPGLPVAQVVAVALVCLPTTVAVALIPDARDLDLPLALLLSIEIAVVLAVGVLFRLLMVVRAALLVGCAAGVIFVGLAEWGQWYAAFVGSALLNAALAIKRRWPAALGTLDRVALGTLGVVVMFLPSVGTSVTRPSLELNAEVLAGAIGVVIAAGLLGERWIAAAALGVVGIEALVVAARPGLLQPAGIASGAVLLALGVAFQRFRQGGLPPPFATVFDALGVWLLLLPTFLLTYGQDAVLQNAVLMAELVVLLVAGLAFRRRWQVMPAIGFLAIQTTRAVIDVANRLPSWATFAVAGALLLTIGFLLLLKREFFATLRRRLMRWWVAWLTTPS